MNTPNTVFILIDDMGWTDLGCGGSTFGRLELYSLREDIGEQRDLARCEPARTTAMHEMLSAWRRGIEAKMPEPNPAFTPWT